MQKLSFSSAALRSLHLNNIEQAHLVWLLENSRCVVVQRQPKEILNLLVFISSLQKYFVVIVSCASNTVIAVLRKQDDSLYPLESDHAKSLSDTTKPVGLEKLGPKGRRSIDALGQTLRTLHVRILIKHGWRHFDTSSRVVAEYRLSDIADLNKIESDGKFKAFLTGKINRNLGPRSYVTCILVKAGPGSVSAPLEFDWLQRP